MHQLPLCLLVGCGGFVGSIARYGLSLTFQRFSIEWPLGTLGSNMLGCLVLGVLVGLSARGEAVSPEARLLLAVGFCGGFTSVSSMIHETTEMLRSSEYVHATCYAGGSFFLSLAAFIAGLAAVRVLVKMGGGAWS